MLLVICLAPCTLGAAEEYIAYPGVIHTHSQFSSGRGSIAELAEMATEQDLKYLVVTDHDLLVMEYGIFPFRNLIKRKEKRPSIIQHGPKKYLQEIAAVNRSQKEVVLIPGAESSAYYYWSGGYSKGTLTANDYHREILLVGIDDPGFFTDLPILHHGPSTRLLPALLPEFIFPFIAVILSILLIHRWRWPGIFSLILCLLFLANARPLRTTPYTPYDGDLKVAPYQDLIDYATANGVLSIWAHPESNYYTKGKKLGPITLKTKKYTGALQMARRYTGYSAIYGDTTTMEKPGREWDALLLDTCNGLRDQPAWAFAGTDFHEYKRSDPLDTYLTVAWAERLTQSSLVEALQKGRCYGVRQANGRGLRLDRFHLQSPDGDLAWSGETLSTKGSPLFIFDMSFSDQARLPVHLRVIRNGNIWYEFEGETPLSVTLLDNDLQRGKGYYRLEAIFNRSSRLLSNPIFVEKQ
jgi:hypothetical protein